MKHPKAELPEVKKMLPGYLQTQVCDTAGDEAVKGDYRPGGQSVGNQVTEKRTETGQKGRSSEAQTPGAPVRTRRRRRSRTENGGGGRGEQYLKNVRSSLRLYRPGCTHSRLNTARLGIYQSGPRPRLGVRKPTPPLTARQTQKRAA